MEPSTDYMSTEEQRNGMFWIPFDALCGYFTRIAIARTAEAWVSAKASQLQWKSSTVRPGSRRTRCPMLSFKVQPQQQDLYRYHSTATSESCTPSSEARQAFITIHQQAERMPGAAGLISSGIDLFEELPSGGCVAVAAVGRSGADPALKGHCVVAELNQKQFVIRRGVQYYLFPYSGGKSVEGEREFAIELHVEAPHGFGWGRSIDLTTNEDGDGKMHATLLCNETIRAGELVSVTTGQDGGCVEVFKLAHRFRLLYGCRNTSASSVALITLQCDGSGFTKLLLTDEAERCGPRQLI